MASRPPTDVLTAPLAAPLSAALASPGEITLADPGGTKLLFWRSTSEDNFKLEAAGLGIPALVPVEDVTPARVNSTAPLDALHVSRRHIQALLEAPKDGKLTRTVRLEAEPLVRLQRQLKSLDSNIQVQALINLATGIVTRGRSEIFRLAYSLSKDFLWDRLLALTSGTDASRVSAQDLLRIMGEGDELQLFEHAASLLDGTLLTRELRLFTSAGSVQNFYLLLHQRFKGPSISEFR